MGTGKVTYGGTFTGSITAYGGSHHEDPTFSFADEFTTLEARSAQWADLSGTPSHRRGLWRHVHRAEQAAQRVQRQGVGHGGDQRHRPRRHAVDVDRADQRHDGQGQRLVHRRPQRDRPRRRPAGEHPLELPGGQECGGQQQLGRRDPRAHGSGVDHQRDLPRLHSRPRRDDQRRRLRAPSLRRLPAAGAEAAGAVAKSLAQVVVHRSLDAAPRAASAQRGCDRVQSPLGGHRLRPERRPDRPGQVGHVLRHPGRRRGPSHRRHVGVDHGRRDDRHRPVRRQHRRQQGRDGRGHSTCGPVGDRREGRQFVLAHRRARRRRAGDRGGPGALRARLGGHRRDRRGLLLHDLRARPARRPRLRQSRPS